MTTGQFEITVTFLGAFLGAFFAFIFMWFLGYVERRRKANIENENALIFVSEAIKEYEILIKGDMEGINALIGSIKEKNSLGCNREPLIFFPPIDFYTIIKIKNKQIRSDLFMINNRLIDINNNLRSFNESFNSEKIFQGDSVLIDGRDTDRDELIKNFECGRDEVKNFENFIFKVKEKL